MRDMLKQKIREGDIVLFAAPHSKNNVIGVVEGFTPKMVKCNRNTTSKHAEVCNKYPMEILVINEQMKIAKETNPEYFI